jgi:hypothetical protein
MNCFFVAVCNNNDKNKRQTVTEAVAAETENINIEK